MSNVFDNLDVIPSHVLGFAFAWRLVPTFVEPQPWNFTVEERETNGPWTAISGKQTNKFYWVDVGRKLVSKDEALQYRVRLDTTDKPPQYSTVVSPYTELTRREYLMVREIMRNELNHMRALTGTPSKLWSKSVYGPQCTYCVDPVLGSSYSSACTQCYGTGVIPGYHGPYDTLMKYTPHERQHEMLPNGVSQQLYPMAISVLGFPPIKKHDIIVDVRADKRFIVDTVSPVASIRRYTLMQQLATQELLSSDPLYGVHERA